MINPSRIFALVCIAGVLVLLSACDREPAPSTTTATSAATATSVPPVSIDSIPDQSLPAMEYITLGIPSYDRNWVGQDMAVAAKKLQALANQSPEKLPRFGSKRSGPMFARIVSADNLMFFQSRSLPLATRFPQALEYGASLNLILKVYLAARVDNKVAGNELIELLGAQLRTVQVQLELVDEFVPTLSKDDPKYPVRMAGLDKMRKGLAELIAGTITTLTEAQFYDVATRAKLLEYCRQTFPNILPKLTAASQQEMLLRLDALIDDPSVREFRSGVISLRDEVRATTKASR